jgi:hypothetical protein
MIALDCNEGCLLALLSVFPLLTCRDEVLGLPVIKDKQGAHPTRHLSYRGCKLFNFSGPLFSIGF